MIARFGILRQLSFYHSFWVKKDCYKDKVSDQSSLGDCYKDKVSDQSSLGKISLGSSILFIFIKLTTQKNLFRKHYKEGASVVTHFWVPPQK